ncbi:MAG: 16S rRNA (guanine(966)-N(2))-methyltransferase RsmD [Gammaproteobacteria bacterium]|nr:16S rRNA (guanine(966)-N(2))-methyltransferase RsmD [Gammaproteobacteria bacterium]
MAKNSNSIRIIAGKWRGRQLTFAPVKDLRPTPDRVRETLFNWLQTRITNKKCLDLFAGSGALGFEALSRGADSVVFVEKQQQAVATLNKSLALLEADNAAVHHCSAEQFIASAKQRFDIIFLDPPYNDNNLETLFKLIETQQLLEPNGLIYFEHDSHHTEPELPKNWQIIRSKKASQVRYYLAESQP